MNFLHITRLYHGVFGLHLVYLYKVSQRRKVILALCAVNAVIDGNEADVFLWENHFTDMDKTTNYAELLTTTENSNRGVSGMLKSETPLFCAGYSMKAKGPIRPMPYSLLTIGLFYPIIKL